MYQHLSRYLNTCDVLAVVLYTILFVTKVYITRYQTFTNFGIALAAYVLSNALAFGCTAQNCCMFMCSNVQHKKMKLSLIQRTINLQGNCKKKSHVILLFVIIPCVRIHISYESHWSAAVHAQQSQTYF